MTGYAVWLGVPHAQPLCLPWVPCILVLHREWHLEFKVNTLRPRQNGRHFADDIFKCIFLNENIWIPIKISLKFVPKGPIYNIPALVQIMAWSRPGDKPYLNQWKLVYRRICASLGLNELNQMGGGMNSYSICCLVLSIQADHNWWSISEQKRDTLPSTQLAISELTFINSRKHCSGDKYFYPRDDSWRVVDEPTAVLHASHMKNKYISDGFYGAFTERDNPKPEQ